MLDAFIAIELAGEDNEIARRHARSALDLANALQHSRTADSRRAAMCVEATSSVVNVISITAGHGDAQFTLGELCSRLVEQGDLGYTHRYAVLRLANSPIGRKLASKLKAKDVIEHCEMRRARVALSPPLSIKTLSI